MCYQLHMLHNPENIVSKKGVFIMILRKSQQTHIFSPSSCINSFQKFDENILSAKALRKFVAREGGY